MSNKGRSSFNTIDVNKQEDREILDLQRIIAILLQVGERPRTVDELGLTRKDVLTLIKTGYFEWKRVIFLTERGRELERWLLEGRKEDEINLFEALKREALRRMAERGNRITIGMKMLGPIHIHILRKLKDRQPVFYADLEKKALKALIRWGLVKSVGDHDILDLTRLGQEFLKCFEEASHSIKPTICFRGGDEKEVE